MLMRGFNTLVVAVACCYSISPWHLPVVGGRLSRGWESTGKNAEFTFTSDYFWELWSIKWCSSVWGADTKISKILGSIVQVTFTHIPWILLQVPRSGQKLNSLHLMYAYSYAIHTYSANTILPTHCLGLTKEWSWMRWLKQIFSLGGR